jgi:excisionase family DNA binding protein
LLLNENMTNLNTGDPLDAAAFYSTAEAAKMLGVSHRTIQLWVESGTLQAWKTAGGHRRISSTSVEKLLDGRRQALSPDRGVPAPAVARQYKVVIADDDATLLRLYELEIGGWDLPLQLIKAGDGFDALLKIGEHNPDLLISDLSMPGMDGFRMVNSLRNNPKQRDLNIIIVSGLDRGTITSLGLPADIPVYAKPVAFSQLRAAIEKTLAI